MSVTKNPTTLRLRTGTEMPFVGLGTWKAEKGVVGKCVEVALKNGYRHIDCASDYGNEQEVGEGIARAMATGIKREEIFITSKLWNTNHHRQHVRPALERTLKDLGVSYLDLYLIHFPISLKYVDPAERYPSGWIYDPNSTDPKMEFSNATIRETWEAMEELVTAGLVKNIGVSNFSCALLMDLLKYARIPPAVNQLEIHPMLQQSILVDFCQKHDIQITAFSPFGALSYYSISEDAKKFPDLLKDDKIIAIANKHQVSPGQVLLRFSIQRNIVVVPKSTDENRLKQNLDVFNFTLDDSDMSTIASYERNARFNDPGVFAKYPIWS